MAISDSTLLSNCDWDPSYLALLFSEEFDDYSSLWKSEVSDMDLVCETNKVEKYCPIVEDISIEDDVLCQEVERIEKE